MYVYIYVYIFIILHVSTLITSTYIYLGSKNTAFPSKWLPTIFQPKHPFPSLRCTSALRRCCSASSSPTYRRREGWIKHPKMAHDLFVFLGTNMMKSTCFFAEFLAKTVWKERWFLCKKWWLWLQSNLFCRPSVQPTLAYLCSTRSLSLDLLGEPIENMMDKKATATVFTWTQFSDVLYLYTSIPFIYHLFPSMLCFYGQYESICV